MRTRLDGVHVGAEDDRRQRRERPRRDPHHQVSALAAGGGRRGVLVNGKAQPVAEFLDVGTHGALKAGDAVYLDELEEYLEEPVGLGTLRWAHFTAWASSPSMTLR